MPNHLTVGIPPVHSSHHGEPSQLECEQKRQEMERTAALKNAVEFGLVQKLRVLGLDRLLKTTSLVKQLKGTANKQISSSAVLERGRVRA